MDKGRRCLRGKGKRIMQGEKPGLRTKDSERLYRGGEGKEGESRIDRVEKIEIISQQKK